MVGGGGFSKGERLRKRREFLALSEKGTKFPSRNFLIILWKTTSASPRIGITASRKVGNAVTRNRIKRIIREFYRLNKSLFSGADYNIIARQGAAGLESPGIRHELTRLLRRISHEHGN